MYVPFAALCVCSIAAAPAIVNATDVQKYVDFHEASLQSLYVNKMAVDDDLVDMLHEPSNDLGALEAFVSIITGASSRTHQMLQLFHILQLNLQSTVKRPICGCPASRDALHDVVRCCCAGPPRTPPDQLMPSVKGC